MLDCERELFNYLISLQFFFGYFVTFLFFRVEKIVFLIG